MRAKVIVALDGRVGIITQEGSFEQGNKVIESLLAELNLNDLEIKLDRPMEQHAHDHPELAGIRRNVKVIIKEG